MILYFRVDANSEIATGHLMRCLTIADTAVERDVDSVFITADNSCGTVLKERGYRNIVLGSDWRDMSVETEQMISLVQSEKIELLIIDSYFTCYDYLSELKKHTKTVYIDDLNQYDYPCDVLLCYAGYWKKFEHTNSEKLILGTLFTPLRSCFRDVRPKEINKKIQSVLILTGGSDNYGIALSFTKCFMELPVNIVTVCGHYNPDIQKIRELGGKQVEVVTFTNDIAALMQNADLAVTAGGTMSYELCACGTPAVSYSLADNQLENCEWLDNNGLIPYAGDVREGMESLCGRVIELFHKLEPYEIRREVSARMQRIFDGYGTERILDEIL